ncbi:MAG: glycerate kinase [Spirochaetaceae bacterium]|jgi:glycerate kinase|nr:glycerate kinase [Spirochaetaceae bacterium]
MKIVVAPDSFKGTNSSLKVAGLMEQGILRVFPKAQIVKVPVADGGEGTVEAVITAMNGNWRETAVNDPLGRGIMAQWGATEDFAVIEMAEASGLTLLKDNERNPLKTSSYGTGQLIEEALNRGYRKILIGLGGSATNDGGTGMARALGIRFFDAHGKEISDGGGNLRNLASINLQNLDPRIIETEITIASDVINPLLGDQGATATYSAQKGANSSMQKTLEEGLKNLADITEKKLSHTLRKIPGAGAAGGLGFGLMAFCGAHLSSGIDTVLDYINFDDIIVDADLIITGEGKIDGQSIFGKVPVGIAKRCKKRNLPLIAIVGDIVGSMDQIHQTGITAVMSTLNQAMPLKEALKKSSKMLIDGTERAMRLLKLGMDLQ